MLKLALKGLNDKLNYIDLAHPVQGEGHVQTRVVIIMVIGLIGVQF